MRAAPSAATHMTLPGAEHAVVEPPTVRDYLLSPAHPVGRFKAQFFYRLGFRQDQWERLRAALLQLALTGEAHEGRPSEHGQKYEVRGILEGPEGAAAVATIWAVLNGEESPRLVTAYPVEEP